MSGILLRSPIYRTVANAPTNSNSTKCTITIDGTLRYTLVKRIQPTETQVWEIAELCRDYIDITFNGTYTPETLTVVTVLTTHASIDGSGSALSTNTFPSSGNDVAYDGYGTWMQGSNPAPKSTLPNWLISGDPKYTSINNQYQIFVPAGIGGSVPYITTSSVLGYSTYSTTAINLTGQPSGRTLLINRIACSKYDIGHKVTFVNKFGALQDLWFFLKDTLVTDRKNEQFQSNTIVNGSYNKNVHSKKVFNTTSSRKISLSSGYYPEWTNQWFEQLLLSEQVWYSRTVFNGASSESTEVVPLNVSTSSFTEKTVLNNKLIQYTFTFDMAFDYINNVR